MGTAAAAAKTASAMELSILKLASPRRKSIHSTRFTFDSDSVAQQLTSPPTHETSLPTSPLWSSSRMVADDEDLFTIFEHHRAAIPFKWEEFPGTCRNNGAELVSEAGAAGEVPKNRIIASGSEEEYNTASSACSAISRSSSSGISSSRSASQEGEEGTHDTISEFQSTPILNTSPSPPPSTTAPKKINAKNGQELGISQGGQQILPLKPPPGMNSIKQLLTLESDDRGIITNCFNSSLVGSSITNTNSPKTHSRRSFRRDGLKALPFLSYSSPRKDFSEDFLTTMLGFEEWPKVVQQQDKQEKQEKQQKDGENRHRRATSMSRLSFSFRKKPDKEKKKDGDDDFLDADAIFSEDFGKKGGLRERRPLTSVSSRGLADGYSNFKSRSWVFDSDTDYSDSEMDTRSDYFDTSHVIAEEDEKDSFKLNSQPLTEKRKKHSRNPFSRVFGSHHHSKPSRLSSVSPAPPPTPPPAAASVAPAPDIQSSSSRSREVKQEDYSSSIASTTSNPLLKMCLSTTIGQVLYKNVRHLRSFEFHTPRALTAK